METLPVELQFKLAAAFKVKDLFGDYINHFMEGSTDEETEDYEASVSELGKDLVNWFLEHNPAAQPVLATPSKADMRESFEQWMLNTHGLGSDDVQWDAGRSCYKKYHAHLAWTAFRDSKNYIKLEKENENG